MTKNVLVDKHEKSLKPIPVSNNPRKETNCRNVTVKRLLVPIYKRIEYLTMWWATNCFQIKIWATHQ